MNNELKKYLGIDWGEARIGLALGDSETKLATPFKTVKNIGEILGAIQEEEIDELIIGVPYKKQDIRNKIQKEFVVFFNRLKEKIKLPVHEVDERLSSKAADALPGGKKTKASRDEIAAMLILQTYFDKM
ncbi:MAG: Holliday junction resolvase RuvX [Patescibacteria group bacterium]|nr:Holliday junction resolvase RuvX [Patescibacteria group bacterium]MDD4610498.1 Holliday junction resolvase RuvX [Patescibacteria group bacterium]